MKRTRTGALLLAFTILALSMVIPVSGILRSQQDRRGSPVIGMPGNGNGESGGPGLRYPEDYGQRPLVPPLLRMRPAGSLKIASAYVVTTAADGGLGSLRAAIDSANAGPGVTSISFNIPGGGVHTIRPASALPPLNNPAIIDGTTQPGYAGSPLIEIDGSLAGPTANGLVITGGSSTVRGLVINRFSGGLSANGHGIVLDVMGGNHVEGNYIGTNAAGTDTLPNGGAGVAVMGSSGGNTIGGTSPQARNVLSGNFSGVAISFVNVGGNAVRGNYIGVNAAGTAALGNYANGVYVNSPHDTVGGVVPGAGNVISGNAFPGVYITAVANGTVVQGNFIGTDATGMVELGTTNGVNVQGASNTIIGDTSAAGRNVIAGNLDPAIYIIGPGASGNLVVGNYLGTNASGTVGMSHGNGLVIDNSTNNTVGGSASGARNLISGCPFPGVAVINGSTGNRVIGNYIGTDASGLGAIPNSKGVLINNSPLNTIGGMAPGERNLISGNTTFGVEIRNAGATGNSILRNFIGTDVSGSTNLGNGADGVVVNSSQDSVLFNRIGFNKGCGVFDSSGTGNLIVGNSMFSNAGLGIDLAPRGLTINDVLDVDTGPNTLLNFPLLDSATVTGGTITVHGRYDGAANFPFQIDFYSNTTYHPSHFGEGETYLSAGYAGVTDISGHAVFSATFPFTLSDHFISATARDNAGNTSEFTQDLCLSDSDGDGILDSWETQGWGIDVNSDGKIDLDLYALGARPDHKDIFVEVDAMTGFVPPDSALPKVVQSFAAVPNIYLNNPDGRPGIALHAALDDTTIPVQDFPGTWTEFDAVKKKYFGTDAQRKDSNAVNILEAKRLVYRYALFARTFGTGGDTNASGIARLGDGLGGNEFMVTFGSTGANGWYSTKAFDDNAGTFMHELGHTLGLRHGGGQDDNYKPNYYSVMNYTWQTTHPWQSPGSWRLDYSPIALPTLVESNLNETTGLNPPAGAYPIIPMPFTDSTGRTRFARLEPGVAVDWTGDGDSTRTAVSVDINLVGDTSKTPNDTLAGYADWSNLQYNFRNSPEYIYPAASPPALQQPRELTKSVNTILDRIPPPKPSGRFLMDGLLDTSAVLLSSNNGINLYARYKSGQLYVATNSAQSQGADMYIFISDAQNPLRGAPSGKGGQVAAWSVYLQNKNADRSAGWFDAGGSLLTSVTVDTAGAVLEGVVDIELLYGRKPAALFIAVGKYGTNPGDTLKGQVPAGNGDRNIDPSELFPFTDAGLPIQLSSFTAAYAPGSGVGVRWMTLSEVNNYGFEVQRKSEGQAEYRAVPNGFTAGHGTTIKPHSYTYLDSTVLPGRWHYRLRQIDLDGTFRFGPDAAANVPANADRGSIPGAFALHQNYPNPFNPSTTLRYDVPAASHVTLRVYNVLGQEVATLVDELQQPGYKSVEFNAGRIASGVYVCRLTAGSFVAAERMVVLK
jgi:hypothetical protein